MKKSSEFKKNKKKKEYNITKNVRNLFRVIKEIDGTAIKGVRNLFRLKKEIDDTIAKDIRNTFRLKAIKDYYKPVTVGNFWSNNYTQYESNGDRNKTLSVEEYLNKIREYLKNIINDLKKPNT